MPSDPACWEPHIDSTAFPFYSSYDSAIKKARLPACPRDNWQISYRLLHFKINIPLNCNFVIRPIQKNLRFILFIFYSYYCNTLSM